MKPTELLTNNPQNDYQLSTTSYEINHESSNQQNKTIIIEPVFSNKELKEFYDFPFTLYNNNPNWVPLFWKEIKDFFNRNNLFWKHADCQLFLAKKGKMTVGRIAAIIDYTFCNLIKKKIGYFGFFECVDNYSYAHQLFEKAEEWLQSKNMQFMRGPINGRVDNGCGFLLEGFDKTKSLLTSYTQPYYLKFAEQYPMQKCRDLISYTINLRKPLPEKLQQRAFASKKQGISLRPFNRWHIKKELKWWIPFFLKTFSKNWGYVPVSEQEVRNRFGVKNIRWHLDPRLFLVAEYKQKPVAYLWATPDYNQVFQSMNGHFNTFAYIDVFRKKSLIKRGILHFIGIDAAFRNHSIGSLLNYEILKEMKKRGYHAAEVGWIDEKNTIALKTIAITGATPYKRHRVFEKNIQNTSIGE